MKRNVNIIVIFNQDKTKLLMCKRKKDPYQGKYNFVGGKIKPGEDHLQAAYRELQEETNITNKDVTFKKTRNEIVENLIFMIIVFTIVFIIQVCTVPMRKLFTYGFICLKLLLFFLNFYVMYDLNRALFSISKNK